MESINQTAQDLSILPYHTPTVIEYGNSEKFLESAQTPLPAKRCIPKSAGNSDVFGSGGSIPLQ